jgi:hypothetical protein
MPGEEYDGGLSRGAKLGCAAAAIAPPPLFAILMLLVQKGWDVFFGSVLILFGAVPIVYGLVTGAMPPFWNKYKNFRDWRTLERVREPFDYWENAALYGLFALWGCYLVIAHW